MYTRQGWGDLMGVDGEDGGGWGGMGWMMGLESR